MEPNVNKSGDEININIKISRSFISSQVAIILGCFALSLFTSNEAIKGLIIVAIALDVIAMILYLLSKHASKDEPSEEQSESAPTPTEKVDVEVKHKGDNKKAVKETTGTIKNKVPIPNPTANNGFAEKPVEEKKDDTPVNLNEDMDGDWSDFY